MGGGHMVEARSGAGCQYLRHNPGGVDAASVGSVANQFWRLVAWSTREAHVGEGRFPRATLTVPARGGG